MLSFLNSIDSSIRSFFGQISDTLGFLGFLAIFVGVELLFVGIFVIKSIFSYELRLKRNLDKLNKWLFQHKKIDENNIVEFNRMIKKGPKRLSYYWQQYILYREDKPSTYLTEQNVIEKPLKTSSWQSNIKNLGMLTIVWTFIAAIFGFASQSAATFSLQNMAVSLVFAAIVAVIGVIAIIALKGKRVLNLDDIYHLYHLFVRFLNNACDDLTPYIDFNLLFTEKEIEKGNPQLREYYEERARKAKEEFDNANKNDVPQIQYNFTDVGVDGSLLLDRAMRESENFITKRNATRTQISQVEGQKEALRRNYENVQMDLQRKIQASKENIAKLIEQQAATTSRMEVGLLRQQQEKEVAKQAEYQKDYEQEEKRYNTAKAELDSEIERLNQVLDAGLEEATKGMTAEYQSFLEKVMKNAYKVAEKKVLEEKTQLSEEVEKNEEELTIVQTQIKRLKDENDTLRDRMAEKDENYQEKINTPEGHYDEQGRFIYADGSYHDADGLFHDVDGKVYNMNGELVSHDETEEEKKEREEKEFIDNQISQFGSYIDVNNNVVKPEEKEEEPLETAAQETAEEETPVEEKAVTEEPVQEENKIVEQEPAKEEEPKEEAPAKKRGRPRKEPKEEEPKEETPAKKRGRPRKEPVEPAVEENTEKRKPGRPRKETKEEEVKEETPAKKRGRPRKEPVEPAVEENTEKRKPGRPRKEKKDDNSLEKINGLLNEEEKKLNEMQDNVNKQIDNALNSTSQNSTDKERDEILKAVEDLKAQADKARTNGTSEEEELAKINKRIEELISKLSQIND